MKITLLLFFATASSLRLQISKTTKEDPALDKVRADYVPYNKLPQYKPDHYKNWEQCSQHPRVAVIIAGRASSMVHPQNVASFREHVVDHLTSMGAQGLAAGSKPDVFVHVKTGEGKVASSRTSIGTDPTHGAVSHQMCDEAAREMGAISTVIEEGFSHVEVKKRECFVTKLQKAEKDHVDKEASYWHSIQGAFQLMTAHENQLNGKYEIVIFHRPDKHWARGVDYAAVSSDETHPAPSGPSEPTELFSAASGSVSCAHGHIWGDQMFILPRKPAQKFNSLYDDLALSEHPKFCGIDRNEDIFRMTAEELKSEGFNIDWTMARKAP